MTFSIVTNINNNHFRMSPLNGCLIPCFLFYSFEVIKVIHGKLLDMVGKVQ